MKNKALSAADKAICDRLVDGHSMCKHSEIVGKNGVLDTVKP